MAEYLRREGYVDLERLLELRARVWVMRVREPRVVAVDFDNADDFDLEPADLVADDYGACQAFADRCRQNPNLPEVIRVPNAALPGTDNLVIFGPRVLSPYQAIHVDQIDVPGGLVADGARPLHTLLEKVRYVGEPHAFLEAWKQGAPFTFEEPDTPILSIGL